MKEALQRCPQRPKFSCLCTAGYDNFPSLRRHACKAIGEIFDAFAIDPDMYVWGASKNYSCGCAAERCNNCISLASGLLLCCVRFCGMHDGSTVGQNLWFWISNLNLRWKRPYSVVRKKQNSPAFVQQRTIAFQVFGGTLAKQLAKCSTLSPSTLICTFEVPQKTTLVDVQQSSCSLFVCGARCNILQAWFANWINVDLRDPVKASRPRDLHWFENRFWGEKSSPRSSNQLARYF